MIGALGIPFPRSSPKCSDQACSKRGENGLEIYVMCEIPNNVI